MDNEFTIRPYRVADGMEMLARQPGEQSPDAEKWCAEAGQGGPARSVFYKDKLILCIGIIKEREGIGQAWALYPPNVGKHHIDPRIARDKLKEWMTEHNLWRVYATVRCDFPAGVTYIEWLGFKREGRMEKNEPDKMDSFLYAIVR